MMSGAPRSERNGFTLVEMLVALIIFALLASAGVGLLRSSVDLQTIVGEKLDQGSMVARLNSLLDTDLEQVLVRPSRAPDGIRPAFVGTEDAMQFVAAGVVLEGPALRSSLRRVEWRGGSSGLLRVSFAIVDGPDSGAVTATLSDAKSEARFRYRRAAGDWVQAFTSSTDEPLPAAVEVTLSDRSRPPLVLLFALPDGARPAPPPAAGAAA